MSRYRFIDPNPDDPAPDRGADATADALDALLNGIAQEHGRPASRPGCGSAGPDARTGTGEEDLLHAAGSFHRRFAAAEARQPGAASPDPQLWEQIMASTSPPAPSARVATSSSPRPHPTAQPAVPARRSRTAHRPFGARSWQVVSNTTLALVVILTAFGAWRVHDGLNGGIPVPESTVSGLAALPATPEATGAVEEPVTTPVETPEPAYACDFSADIPIFQRVDASPVDGTAIVLTTTGELVLTCPEEPEAIVLATGSALAGPANWPGIVGAATGLPGDDDIRVVYIDVVTGATIDAGFADRMHQLSTISTTGSPWLVWPSADDSAQWAVTDFRTMQTRLLSSLVGADLPDEQPIIASANASGRLAIALVSSVTDAPEETGADAVPHDRGGILIVDGGLEETRWIPLPDELPRVLRVSLSPDGTHVALQGVAFASLMRIADGSEIGRIEGPFGTESDQGMTWVQGGRALTWIADAAVMMLAIDGNGSPTAVYEADADLASLRPTYHPDVVLVTRLTDHMAPGQAHSRVLSVNTVTGEVIEIPGRDVSENGEPVTRFLVMGFAPIHTMNRQSTTFEVVDAVTGDVVGSIADVPITQNPLGPPAGLRSLATTSDGSVEVIAFDASHIYALRMGPTGPEIHQLPGVETTIETYVDSLSLWLSDDGTMLSLTIRGDTSGNRYLLNLEDASAQWIVSTPDGGTEVGEEPTPIQFVHGTGS